VKPAGEAVDCSATSGEPCCRLFGPGVCRTTLHAAFLARHTKHWRMIKQLAVCDHGKDIPGQIYPRVPLFVLKPDDSDASDAELAPSRVFLRLARLQSPIHPIFLELPDDSVIEPGARLRPNLSNGSANIVLPGTLAFDMAHTESFRVLFVEYLFRPGPELEIQGRRWQQCQYQH
jgi:hypothetical protein